MTELTKVVRRLERAQAQVAGIRHERDELIVSLYRAGESPKLLAEVAGMTQQGLFKIIRARDTGQAS